MPSEKGGAGLRPYEGIRLERCSLEIRLKFLVKKVAFAKIFWSEVEILCVLFYRQKKCPFQSSPSPLQLKT